MKLHKGYSQNIKNQGFTLIEIMVAVVIIGILIAISFPIFQSQELKNQRSQAINWLSQLRLEMERCASNYNGNYTQCGDAGLTPASAFVTPIITQKYNELHYNVTVTINTINLVPGAGYTLTATEITGNDADCTRLSIDSFGNKTSTGTRPNNIRCWGSN